MQQSRWSTSSGRVLRGAVFIAVVVLAQTANAFTNAKLNGPFHATDGDVQGVRGTPDGTRVVYLADGDINGREELYSANSSGSGTPVKLSSGTASIREEDWSLTPDGSRVVFRTAQDTPGVTELYSRPVDGSSAAIKLNGTMAGDGDVRVFLISPNSARVVYLADQDIDGVRELYSVPADGSSAAVKLNGALISGRGVEDWFLISPDSTRVIYVADQITNNVFELFMRPIDGSGSPTKLSKTLPSGGDVVEGLAISSDNNFVVYRADGDTNNVFELYSTALAGGSPSTKISNTTVSPGNVQPRFVLSPATGLVIYLAGSSGAFQLYSTPISVSSPTKLNGIMVGGGSVDPDFAISPDSSRVVYRADQDTHYRKEIYSRPADGSGSPVKLNGPITGTFSGVESFAITPDSSGVVFVVTDSIYSHLFRSSLSGPGSAVMVDDQSGLMIDKFQITPDSARVIYLNFISNDESVNLFVRPLSLATPSIKLNNTLVSGGSVFDFEVASPANRVLYIADQDTDEVAELYSRPLDGSGSSTKLNTPLALGGTVQNDFVISPDSSHAIYRANQEIPFSSELYVRATDGSGGSLRLSETGQYVYEHSISPDSSRAVYLVDGGKLFSRVLDASAPLVDLTAGKITWGYQISPNSSRIVYPAGDGSAQTELYSRALDGSDSAVSISGPVPDGTSVGFISITADSTRVVFTLPHDPGSGVVEDVYVAPSRWFRGSRQAQRRAGCRWQRDRLRHQPQQRQRRVPR